MDYCPLQHKALSSIVFDGIKQPCTNKILTTLFGGKNKKSTYVIMVIALLLYLVSKHWDHGQAKLHLLSTSPTNLHLSRLYCQHKWTNFNLSHLSNGIDEQPHKIMASQPKLYSITKGQITFQLICFLSTIPSIDVSMSNLFHIQLHTNAL